MARHKKKKKNPLPSKMSEHGGGAGPAVEGLLDWGHPARWVQYAISERCVAGVDAVLREGRTWTDEEWARRKGPQYNIALAECGQILLLEALEGGPTDPQGRPRAKAPEWLIDAAWTECAANPPGGASGDQCVADLFIDIGRGGDQGLPNGRGGGGNGAGGETRGLLILPALALLWWLFNRGGKGRN